MLAGKHIIGSLESRAAKHHQHQLPHLLPGIGHTRTPSEHHQHQPRGSFWVSGRQQTSPASVTMLVSRSPEPRSIISISCDRQRRASDCQQTSPASVATLATRRSESRSVMPTHITSINCTAPVLQQRITNHQASSASAATAPPRISKVSECLRASCVSFCNSSGSHQPTHPMSDSQQPTS